jgi:hypothetical protein
MGAVQVMMMCHLLIAVGCASLTWWQHHAHAAAGHRTGLVLLCSWLACCSSATRNQQLLVI